MLYMPIRFDLEKIINQYNCSNYFETGLYDPRRENASIKQALKTSIEKVYSIEIRKDFVEMAKKDNLISSEINKNRCNVYCDDSVNLYKYIQEDNFKNKTIFFFDAHVDNDNIKNYKTKCPLFYELNALKEINRKDNIICIDDLRILKTNNPWGETNKNKVNYIDEIKKNILDINPEYKFSTLDGIIKDDVLLAYI